MSRKNWGMPEDERMEIPKSGHRIEINSQYSLSEVAPLVKIGPEPETFVF
jgi:hypothetical protein